MNARILIIEDDKLWIEWLNRVFTTKGFFIEITDNPMKAMLRIANRDFDLVILDYNLPGINGDSIEPFLLKMKMPALYFTGYSSDEIKTSLPVITKNGSLNPLLEKVGQMLDIKTSLSTIETKPSSYPSYSQQEHSVAF